MGCSIVILQNHGNIFRKFLISRKKRQGARGWSFTVFLFLFFQFFWIAQLDTITIFNYFAKFWNNFQKILNFAKEAGARPKATVFWDFFLNFRIAQLGNLPKF